MMLAQRLAQGRAGADALEHVAGDAAKPWAGRESFLDGERAIEGEARLEQGRELLGEGHEIATANAALTEAHAGETRQGEALALGRDLYGKIRVALEPLDDAACVARLHDAVDGLAALVGCLIGEVRHATAFQMERRELILPPLRI